MNLSLNAAYLVRERASAPADRFRDFILRLDFVFLYFVLFTASSAVYRYGSVNTYLWYIIYLWAAGRMALELPTFSHAARRAWPVFLWPALAIISVAWSLAPAASLRGGFQLLMTTMIAVFIGARFSLRHLLLAITLVLLAATIASLILLALNDPEVYNISGGFRGTFAHKNTLGLRMNIMISTALVLFMSWPAVRAPMAAVGLLAIYVLALTLSATSQILALITPGIIAVMWTARRSIRHSLLTCAALLTGGAIVFALLFVSSADPIAFGLESFGKDATLTGRTWLWEIGADEASKHPILGGGYQAFWSDAHSTEVMWIRHILLESVNGFHNVGIEVWNDLGFPGLAALVFVLGFYAFQAFGFYGNSPSALGFYPIFFLIILVVSGMVNNSFFRQHELVHILFCAFFTVIVSAARRQNLDLVGAYSAFRASTPMQIVAKQRGLL